MIKSDKQITGMTGVYLVAAELSQRGLITTVTSRNVKAADILAATPDAKKTFAVQVKTNSTSLKYWLVGEHLLHTPNLIYVFVRLKKDKPCDFYVVHSKSVARNTFHEKYGKTKTYWHSFVPAEKDLNNWVLFD